MNCEWNNVKNRPQTAEVVFLKTELRKLSVHFLNLEANFGSVRFLETDIRHFHRVPHTPKENNGDIDDDDERRRKTANRTE